MPDKIYFIVPLKSECDDLQQYTKMLDYNLALLVSQGVASEESRILFIENRFSEVSRDRLRLLCDKYIRVSALFTAHTGTVDIALTAGILEAYDKKADVVIALEIDRTGETDNISEILSEYRRGFTTVWGDSPDGRFFLLGKRGIEAFSLFSEKDASVPEIISLIGFKSAVIGADTRVFRKSAAAITPMTLCEAFAGLSAFSALTGLIWLIICRTPSSVLLLSAGILGCMVFFSLWLVCGYVETAERDLRHRPRFIPDEKLD